MKIILTATITPQSDVRLHLTNPEDRRNDYLRSLARWHKFARTTGAQLILIENSGADLERLVRDATGMHQDHVIETISASPPTENAVRRGKGACEAEMLNQAIEKLWTSTANDTWYKCTGRLYIPNASTALVAARRDNELVLRMTPSFSHADARVFGGHGQAWKEYLYGLDALVDEIADNRIEKVLPKRAALAISKGARIRRFGTRPLFEGRSGTWADRDYSSLATRMTHTVTLPIERLMRGRLSEKHY